MAKVSGIVKWFNNAKGYGFIIADEREYFVHYKSIEGEGYKTPAEGARVLFTSAVGDKGPVASDVEIC